MHHVKGCMCLQTVSISSPWAIATAAVISSMIPHPGPWLAPPISSARETHVPDHSKDEGNPWVRAHSC